jgi:hypothetical protein
MALIQSRREPYQPDLNFYNHPSYGKTYFPCEVVPKMGVFKGCAEPSSQKGRIEVKLEIDRQMSKWDAGQAPERSYMNLRPTVPGR